MCKEKEPTFRDTRTKLIDTFDSSLVLRNSKLLSFEIVKGSLQNESCIVYKKYNLKDTCI